VARVSSLETWEELREALASLASSPPAGIKSVVIDSATKAEAMAGEYVIRTKKTEKGQKVDSLEGFGWGKGYQLVADEMALLIGDLDRIAREAGMNVALIAHEVSSPVPNPAGDDFLRWEPFLFAGDKKGRGSTRDRVLQWADHALFIGYDLFVSDGKAQGSGTRTVYTAELPTHRAKSRTAATSLPYVEAEAGNIWGKLGVAS
jgi:hypothetical protein